MILCYRAIASDAAQAVRLVRAAREQGGANLRDVVDLDTFFRHLELLSAYDVRTLADYDPDNARHVVLGLLQPSPRVLRQASQLLRAHGLPFVVFVGQQLARQGRLRPQQQNAGDDAQLSLADLLGAVAAGASIQWLAEPAPAGVHPGAVANDSAVAARPPTEALRHDPAVASFAANLTASLGPSGEGHLAYLLAGDRLWPVHPTGPAEHPPWEVTAVADARALREPVVAVVVAPGIDADATGAACASVAAQRYGAIEAWSLGEVGEATRGAPSTVWREAAAECGAETAPSFGERLAHVVRTTQAPYLLLVPPDVQLGSEALCAAMQALALCPDVDVACADATLGGPFAAAAAEAAGAVPLIAGDAHAPTYLWRAPTADATPALPAGASCADPTAASWQRVAGPPPRQPWAFTLCRRSRWLAALRACANPALLHAQAVHEAWAPGASYLHVALPLAHYTPPAPALAGANAPLRRALADSRVALAAAEDRRRKALGAAEAAEQGRAEAARAHEAALGELRRAHEARTAQLTEAAEAAQAEMARRHAAQCAAMAEAHARDEAEAREAQRAAHQAALAEREAALAAAKGAMGAAAAEQKAALAAEAEAHRTTREALSARHAAEREALRRAHAQHCAAQAEADTARQRAEAEAHARTVESLRQAHAAEQAELGARCAAQAEAIAAHQAAHAEAVAAHQAAKAELAAAREAAKAELDAAREAAKAELDAAREAAEAELDAARRAGHNEAKAAAEGARDALVAAHALAQAEAVRAQRAERAESIAAHEAALAQARQEAQAARAQADDAVRAARTAAIDATRAAHEGELARLVAQCATLDAHNAELAATLDAVYRSHSWRWTGAARQLRARVQRTALRLRP